MSCGKNFAVWKTAGQSADWWMADSRCAEQYHPRSLGDWLRGRADERPSLCQITHGVDAQRRNHQLRSIETAGGTVQGVG